MFCPSQIKNYIITGLVSNFFMHLVTGWHLLFRKEITISMVVGGTYYVCEQSEGIVTHWHWQCLSIYQYIRVVSCRSIYRYSPLPTYLSPRQWDNIIIGEPLMLVYLLYFYYVHTFNNHLKLLTTAIVFLLSISRNCSYEIPP